MILVRRVARPMLAAIYVSGGVQLLRNPKSVLPVVDSVLSPISRRIPSLPQDPEQLVKLNAAVQTGGGVLLALGRFPRISALALALTTVPTTLAAHRFWEETDPAQKANQQVHFVKNLGLLGGLLLAAVDTEGSPSLAWRARHARKTTRHAVKAGRREAGLAARTARSEAKSVAKSARQRLPR